MSANWHSCQRCGCLCNCETTVCSHSCMSNVTNQPTQYKDFKDINREVVAKLLPRATKIGMDMTDVDAIVTVLEECFMAAWSAALASQGDEIKALRAELDAAWGVRGDTNITDEYKRGFMAALYTVHTAMLAARKDGSS
jgi:hypothetical protein